MAWRPEDVPRRDASRRACRDVDSEALDLVIKVDDLKNENGVVRSIKKFFGKKQPRKIALSSMAEVYLGTARARLGPAAALIDLDPSNSPGSSRVTSKDDRWVIAACEENRLTRAVDSSTAGPPDLSIAELLRFLGRERRDITRVLGVADEGDVDAHRAHAEYAFRASGFDQPLVLVCGAEMSAWLGVRSGGAPKPHSSITR